MQEDSISDVESRGKREDLGPRSATRGQNGVPRRQESVDEPMNSEVSKLESERSRSFESDKPDISMILPARNEGRFVTQTLEALQALTPLLRVQALLVDNGSSDDTKCKAIASGAVVLDASGSVSAVRNLGARHARAETYAFVDADVKVTEAWREAMPSVIRSLEDEPLQVIGARCHAPDDGSFLNTYWFGRLMEYRADYVNSGNLITSRTLFELVEGFDERLATAEDYDFCRRARASGARVVDDPRLAAVHLGYPETLAAFVRRERWHGAQDFIDLSSVKASKIAWLSLANIALVTMFVTLSIAVLNAVWLMAAVLVPLCMGGLLTAHRYGIASTRKYLGTSLVYGLYICARSLSVYDSFGRKSGRGEGV